MLGKALLLYTSDKVGARRLTTCLRAAGSEVVTLDDVDAARQLISARAVDLVLFDYALADDLSPLAWSAAGAVPFVVLAAGAEDHATLMLEVVVDFGVSHVIGTATPGEGLSAIDPREVAVSAEKILGGDVFGANKYLPEFAVDRSSYEIRGADDRDEVIECVQDYLRWLGAGGDVVRRMALVVDELVTNAVYNAPRDEHGDARYAHLDRRDKIELDPWEHAQVELGCDGRWFVFSISDWFGGLTLDRIRDRLRQCLGADDQIERKQGGAGLGLYTVLRSVSQLIINVEPGRRTEVIAVVDLSRRKAAGCPSLHLFTSGAHPVTARPDDTVVLSPELRRELLASVAPDKGRVVPLMTPKGRPKQRMRTEPGIFVTLPTVN